VNYDTAGELFAIIKRELMAVSEDGVDAADVQLVQNYFLGRHQMNLQTVGRISDFYAERFANYGEVSPASEVPARIAAITAEAMVGTAREILAADIYALVAVGSGDRKQVERLGEILPELAGETA
jgi:predicted Zn-dependent peptidase